MWKNKSIVHSINFSFLKIELSKHVTLQGKQIKYVPGSWISAWDLAGIQ